MSKTSRPGGTRQRRRYSDEERAEAVLAVKMNGGNVKHTAVQPGIPEATLRGWSNAERGTRLPQRNPPDAKVHAKKQEGLSSLLDNAIRDALGYLPEKWTEATAREIAIAIGVFIDKKQLLDGEPTELQERRIIVERDGISTLPEHLARKPASHRASA